MLEKMLLQAVKIGGHALRVMPGRRITVMTPSGEREMQNIVQTASSIEQLLGPVLVPEVRKRLAAGRTEWAINVTGIGQVGIRAELTANGIQAVFRLVQAAGSTPAANATNVAAARSVASPVGSSVASASMSPGPGNVPTPNRTATAADAAPTSSASDPAPAASQSTPERQPARIVEGAVAEMEELFRTMVERKASDLHLCVGSPPMLRHDGEIKIIPGRPVLTADEAQRLLWSIGPEQNREEFKRRHDTDFAYEIPGLARFRCNWFMDRKGMGGVFRVIPSKIITAEDMGLSKEILQLCHLPKGLVLVTGPTGSGKSTTLCALIDYINRVRTDHILTIEDPLEFVHENKKCLINQRQIGQHTDSFKDALRAALREDPDIVLVGEMRDLETTAIAIETAETGHLVFGTLHTSSAASTVDRIIDQFPADRQGQIRVMLSESLKGVISQMLCKKIGGGRVPVLEVMIVLPAISNLIREAKVFQIPSIIQTGKRYGMMLMNESFTDLVKKKIVEPQEAYSKAVDKSGLLSQFKKNDIDVSWIQSDSGTNGSDTSST